MNKTDTLIIDDRELQALFRNLTPRERLRAIRGAFRKEALRVRNLARRELVGSGIHNATGLSKGVRHTVRDVKGAAGASAGYIVTCAVKGKQGIWTNRYGKEKPALVFLELGAKERVTKSAGSRTGRNGRVRTITRKRSAHSTGTLPAYGFIRKTALATKAQTSAHLTKAMQDSIIKEALKHGCS